MKQMLKITELDTRSQSKKFSQHHVSCWCPLDLTNCVVSVIIKNVCFFFKLVTEQFNFVFLVTHVKKMLNDTSTTSLTWTSWLERWFHLYVELFVKYASKPEAHDRLLITDRGSTRPSETATDRSRAVGEGLLRSMHSVSVPSHRARPVGRSSSGNPHPVGSCGSAFQNQSSARARDLVIFPPVLQAAPTWGNCDSGCASI